MGSRIFRKSLIDAMRDGVLALAFQSICKRRIGSNMEMTSESHLFLLFQVTSHLCLEERMRTQYSELLAIQN